MPQKDVLTERNNITLSEDIYHQQYNDIYSWNNIVQINKFRERTCLFIGTSFTDPNLRRLLDIAMYQRGSEAEVHYLIKQKYQKRKIMEKIEVLLNQNRILRNQKEKASLKLEETATYLKDIMEIFTEQDALSFGVSTIWVD